MMLMTRGVYPTGKRNYQVNQAQRPATSSYSWELEPRKERTGDDFVDNARNLEILLQISVEVELSNRQTICD